MPCACSWVRICVVVRPRQSVIRRVASSSDKEFGFDRQHRLGQAGEHESPSESLADKLLAAGQDPALVRIVGEGPVALPGKRVLLAAHNPDDVAAQPHKPQIGIHPVVG